jgi:hypothetical protein
MVFRIVLSSLFLVTLCIQSVTGQARLIESSEKKVVFEFTLPEPKIETITLDGQEYIKIDFEKARLTDRPGAPLLPYVSEYIGLPPEAKANVTFEILAQESISDAIALPAIPSLPSTQSSALRIDETIYGQPQPYPLEIVEVFEPTNIRFINTLKINLFPVQYFPAQKEIRMIRKLRITIIPQNARIGGYPLTLSPVEKDYHKQRLLNFQSAEKWVLARQHLTKSTAVNYDFNTGVWLKIPVKTEGIYRITGSDLSSNGIDLNSVDINTIQMFNNGGDPLPVNVTHNRPADLNEIAIQVIDANNNGRLDNNESILFYGRATNGYRLINNNWQYSVNPYSATNYYLLTVNQNTGKRIAQEASPNIAGATPSTEFTDLHYFGEDRHNILESGLDWYWERFQGRSQQKTISFDLPGSIKSGNATFSYRLKGGSGAHWYDNGSYRYTVNLFLNGSQLGGNIVFSTNSERVNSLSVSNLQPGENNFMIDYSANLEGSYMFLDYFEVRAPRDFRAENNFLKFYYEIGSTPVAFSISNLAAGNNRIWDVTDFANVRQINPLTNGTITTFHEPAQITATQHCYYAFSDAFIKPVSEIQRIENHPNLRDPNRTANLLILTSKAFYDIAADWEALKESQFPGQMSAERILVDDIFLEFSSGMVDPTAIRDFLKYAYENWGSNSGNPALNRPHYVQLIGDGSYDYRNIVLTDYQNHVPTFQITFSDDITSRCTDLFFTAFGTTTVNSMDPQLPIARFPANSVSEIANYLNKLRTYQDAYLNGLESYAGWQSTITLVADDECTTGGNCGEYYHTEQSERIFRKIPRKFDVRKIYMVDYDTQAGGLGRLKPKVTSDLLDQVNRGTLIINFFGHGDPNTWAHEQALTRARDLPLIQNSGRVPLWIAATCTWGKYDNPAIPSMAEEMVWEAEGGGIASLAASRPTFSFDNLFFVEDFVQFLYNDRSESKHSRILGDAFNLSLSGSVNDQKYHLLGDVALRMADPTHQVKVTSVTSEGADTLKALSRVVVNAEITDSSGTLLSNFNGKALIRVYDAIDSVFNTVINRRYVYQGGTIFKGVVTVTNGRIEDAGFIVPKSIKYKADRTGRISIYAWSEDGDAGGFKNDLLFFGTSSQANDAEGPEIKFTFANQPDFFDGDFIPQQAELIVELSDENGLNLTGEVGHHIELVIDGTIRKNVTDFFVYDVNSFTSGKLRYTLPPLANGSHTLKIIAWDNLNNFSESELRFTTAEAGELLLDRVVNYPNPFADETQFTFQYQSPNGLGDVRIKIYTVYGRLIREIRDVAKPGFNKIPWDGRDEAGDLVANGVYLYKIVINDGEKTIEKIEKLAITR